MKTVSILAALVTAVALSSCSQDAASPEEDSPSQLNVMLSYHEGLSWLPMPIAQKLNYFGDDYTLNIQSANGSGYVTQQLLSGNIDAGWAGAADTIVAFSRDQSVRAFICQPPGELFQIVTPEGSGIQQMSDLRGRKLGITEKGGGEEPIVNAALKDAGIDPMSSDITILPIGSAGPQTLSAIQDGTVDAYASSYPDIISLEVQGLTFRDITPAKYQGVPGDCLITTTAVLEDNAKKQQITEFARGWMMGGTFAQANPEAALTIGCEAYPSECQDPAFAEAYVNEFIDLTAGNGEHPFGYVPIEDWTTTHELLADAGLVPADLDMTTLAADQLVTQVQDEADSFDAAAVQTEAKDYAG